MNEETKRESPQISIIVASFNSINTLSRTIESVLSQTYLNKELIIIDGGSKDGTVDVLKRFDESISYWCSKPDKGIYNAWNKALDYTKGDWLYFLGADDYLWASDVLERIAQKLMKARPKFRVVYGMVNIVREDGTVLEILNEPWDQAKKNFRQQMTLCHQGVFHDRSLFDLHGKFDESFQILGDYEFLLRELKIHDAAFIDDVVIAGMQHGGISSDPSKALSMHKEILRARLKNGIKGISFYLLWIRMLLLIRVIVQAVFGDMTAGVLSDLYRIITGKPRIYTK